ncbi:MAG: ribosome silencing factor [Bacteroidales bacterium]|mgnify:CR=1 FL=1|jgi:ribosome-associated protein|nr:ribosome silencing factor [Bacteroidales bacterium]MDD4384313.1 ribosome silencing factor [Bacteroidales bacterium]MDY0198647.1 ribosome silencing factor [Tenuifilaceae bacterium]
MAKRDKDNTDKLHSCIINAISDKKALDIISLDLGTLPKAVCKHFIICHADSNMQVRAIADNIEEKVIEKLKERPWQKGGYENSIWVILDYVDIVVHIFQTEWRQFYKLEELWADANRTTYE